jgi:SAM-dependent methyltransferase
MIYRRMPALLRILPAAMQRHILHFESRIEDAARQFAALVPAGRRVLDAGAGESQYEELFGGLQYIAVDLGVGDAGWSYSKLDAVADLGRLPFRDESFAGVVNIVTLEHVRYPRSVIVELARVLEPGGLLLLVTPLDWEEHQQPHDYYRYTRYGVEHLIRNAGLRVERLEAVGGFFRLLSRRLLNAPQFFPGPVAWLVLAMVALPALLLPLLDGLDERRAFTLGHICIARKP